MEYLGPKRLSLLQKGAVFPLGMDSMLLSEFATLRRNDRVYDLGCGIGTLMLLLFSRQEALTISGMEIQREAASLARENLARNGLCERASVAEGDLRAIPETLAPGGHDLVISNPPYFSLSAGKPAGTAARAQARCALSCSASDVCRAAAHLLRPKGRFAFLLRPERLEDWMGALRDCGLAPKRLRCVQHTPQSPPSLLLLEAMRGGNVGLSFLPPLFASDWNARQAKQMKHPANTAGQEATP